MLCLQHGYPILVPVRIDRPDIQEMLVMLFVNIRI